MPKLQIDENREGHSITLDLMIGSSLVDTEKIFKFGCKAGACGKCLVTVLSGMENLSSPTHKELRGLNIFRKGDLNARLACQLKIIGDCRLKIKGV